MSRDPERSFRRAIISPCLAWPIAGAACLVSPTAGHVLALAVLSLLALCVVATALVSRSELDAPSAVIRRNGMWLDGSLRTS